MKISQCEGRKFGNEVGLSDIQTWEVLHTGASAFSAGSAAVSGAGSSDSGGLLSFIGSRCLLLALLLFFFLLFFFPLLAMSSIDQ